MADLIFVGQFVASKAGKTGLTVTVDVDRYTISDGSRSSLVTAGSATEGRRGLYHYRLASADLSLYQYVATFITSDATVDQQEVAAIGLVVPDTLVSSRSDFDAGTDTVIPSGGTINSVSGSVGSVADASAIATAVGAQTAETYTWQQVLAALDHMITRGMGGVKSWSLQSLMELSGADLDTLKTLSDQLDEIPTGTPPSAATIADAVLDEVVEGSYTLRQIVRIMAAALAGKSTGGGTTEVSFVGLDGTTTRIVATVDASGNRTAVTKTVT